MLYFSQSTLVLSICIDVILKLSIRFNSLIMVQNNVISQCIHGVQCEVILKNIGTGPVFCLLLRVSSGCAQPITGQVTLVTWPVIGWAQSELTPSKRQKTGPGDLYQPTPTVSYDLAVQISTQGYLSKNDSEYVFIPHPTRSLDCSEPQWQRMWKLRYPTSNGND